MRTLAAIFLSFVLMTFFHCSSDIDETGDYGWDNPAGDGPFGDPAEDFPYEVIDVAPPDLVDMSDWDLDGDGYTQGGGDCNDSVPQINPGAYDHPGNGVDEDCDGRVDNPPTGCDCGSGDLVDGIDLCDKRFLLGSERICHTSRGMSQGAAVRPHYGDPGNGLAVMEGCAYSIMATGPVDLELCDDNRQIGTDFYGDWLWDPCLGGEEDPDPSGASDGAPICDTHQLVLQLRAPPNANGFSFDFVYLSAEYPEWVGEGFNDTFYAIFVDHLTSERKNISFDDYGAEIEVDNAFFEDPPVTNINGTGYEFTCENEIGPPVSICGSSTGWLRTAWNIEPGQDFDLIFSIHDEGDGIYDSAVILDNFQWSAEPVDEGTIPII